MLRLVWGVVVFCEGVAGLLPKPNDGFGLFGSFELLKNADIKGIGGNIHMLDKGNLDEARQSTDSSRVAIEQSG